MMYLSGRDEVDDMRSRATLLLAAAVIACGDPTAPTREATLSFCPGTVWAGIQNQGEAWRTVAGGPATVTIDARERLVVAVVTFGGIEQGDLAFYYLTRDQAEATFVCAAAGTKRLSGSVAGIGSGSARVSMGGSTAPVSSFSLSYALENVPDGQLDLVATHRNTAIVRRGVNYPDGATIPLLDFASAETFPLQANALTVELNGLVAPQWTTEVMTQGGTHALLSFSGPPCCTDGRIYSLPASHRESGDLHRLRVSAGSGADGRWVERFYAMPSDVTVTIGPPANGATLTTVSTPGDLWRAEIVAQPEYQSQIELIVTAPQPSTNQTRVVIRASKEHFGGMPTTWTFTVPDLWSVAGFPSTWPKMFAPGGWNLVVSDAPWLRSLSTARDGDVYRSAFTY